MTDLLTPIDRWLAEQQTQTAVDRFSRRHDELATSTDTDVRWYADRLPAAAPGPGQQYAFRVDLDRCTGCKACVAACHSLNGLDEGESWRDVGQLVSTTGDAEIRTVPSGCHHCVEPACLTGCPTDAYEKDPITGIVRHLDDQCFGCGYCTLTCPYEVPRMNDRLGIVRKCDLCADRLAEGEAPACVQGCPTSAITIAVVDTETLVADALFGSLVPDAPDSTITVPSTQYVSTDRLPDRLVAADAHALHPAHAHTPLTVMLVLMQTSVGGLIAAALAAALTPAEMTLAPRVAATGVALGAIATSIAHLGRPLVAWRAVLGVGHSWLSREIVAFGAYATAATAAVVVGLGSPDLLPVADLGAAALGVAGTGTSIMVYRATRRRWWAARFTVAKFVLTSASTGPLLLVTALLWAGSPLVPEVAPWAVATAVAATGLTLASEGAFVATAQVGDLERTRRLLVGPLRSLTVLRFQLGVAAMVAALLVLVVADAPPDAGGPELVATTALALTLAGALVERHEFFVASVAPRMPGALR